MPEIWSGRNFEAIESNQNSVSIMWFVYNDVMLSFITLIYTCMFLVYVDNDFYQFRFEMFHIGVMDLVLIKQFYRINNKNIFKVKNT